MIINDQCAQPLLFLLHRPFRIPSRIRDGVSPHFERSQIPCHLPLKL
jgi:hypothetical protein